METKKAIMRNFKIEPRMNGSKLRYVVLEEVDEYSTPCWPFSKPKIIGKKWWVCGKHVCDFMCWEGGFGHTEPYYFTTKKKAKEYVKNKLLTKEPTE